MRSFIVPLLVVATTSILAQSGTLDPSFNTTGIQILQPGIQHDVANDVVALADTTLLVCGVTNTGAAFFPFITHLLQDGSVDTNWGTSAGYTTITIGLEGYLYDMVVAADGSIFLCGTTYITFAQSEVLLVKLLADGTPDPGFGTNGVIHTAIGSGDAIAQGIALQDDGKIVLGGSAGPFGAYDALVMRYHASGDPDSTFSGDGIQTAAAYASEDLLMDVDILDDGSIVGAGWADIIGDMKTVLVRVDANGDFVNTFGGDGVLVPGFSVTTDRAFGIMSDGQQFVVCGSYSDDPNNANAYLAKFNDDGTQDLGFGTGGWAITDTDVNEVALDLAVQPDGKWLICGTTGQSGFGVPRDFLVARFSDTGIADATFGTGGVTITSIGIDFDDANGITLQPDGKVVCAGFTSGFSLGEANDIAVVRYLNDDGTGVPHDLQATTTLIAFPNPADDVVTLSIDGPATAAAFRCTDARGQAVPLLVRMNGPRTLQLSVAGLSPGLYLLTDDRGHRVRFMKR